MNDVTPEGVTHKKEAARGRRGRAPSRIQSRLEPGEVRAALRGLKLRHYREVAMVQTDCDGRDLVSHMGEVVAQRTEKRK